MKAPTVADTDALAAAASDQIATNRLYDPRCDRSKPIPGSGCARDMNTCRYPECTFPEAAPAAERG